jgi:PAS domain S-box-containing protein
VSGVEDLKRLGAVSIGKGHLRRVGKLKVGRGFSERLNEVLSEATDRKDTASLSAEIAMAVVETSHEAFVGMDAEGVITTWNPAAEETFGWEAEDVIGKPVADTLAPEDLRDPFRKALERFLWTGEAEDLDERVELGVLHRDGHEVPVEATISSFKGTDGGLHFHAFMRDMSSREAEEERRHRAETYREAQLAVAGVLASSPSIADALPRVIEALAENLDWDLCAHWAAGQGSVSVTCKSFWTRESVDAEEYKRVASEITLNAGEGLPGRVLESKSPVMIEDVGEGPASVRTELAAQAGLRGSMAMPLLLEGHVAGVLEFFSRHARPVDEELIQTLSVISSQIGQFIDRREAEAQSEKIKDEFFSLVSHELRTPLTSVIGYTDMLAKKEGSKLSEQGRKMIDVIKRNAKREMRLVGDLLLLVRIEGGRFELLPGKVELPQIAAQSVEAAGPAAEKMGIRLNLKSDPVPAFEGDPDRLGQVIDNLLTNAIKFTYGDGEVAVRIAQEGVFAVIEVADNGRGISEEDQQHLFERLYRASSATEDHVPGTGLGLTIVKAITEAHGGQINVRSELGKGTTFRIELPMKPVRGDEVAPSQNGSAPAAEAAPAQNGNAPAAEAEAAQAVTAKAPEEVA